MKGAGYNTHGKKRYTAKDMCNFNQGLVESATKEQLTIKREQQKGLRANMRDLYMNLKAEEQDKEENIKKFNDYANKLIKMGCKKEIILSWIEDLIKSEDKDTIFETIKADKSNEEKINDDNDR